MRQVWETEDGEIFSNEEDAKRHEISAMGIRHLEELVGDEVSYFDNQRIVLDFIRENKDTLVKILKDIG